MSDINEFIDENATRKSLKDLIDYKIKDKQ